MAFTGTPVIKIVSDNLVRITGISLVEPDSGTIGLDEYVGAPDIRMPAAFRPRRYAGADAQFVSLQDSVQVSVVMDDTSPAARPVPYIVKTGTDPTDFLITVSEPSGGDTSGLELYIRFH